MHAPTALRRLVLVIGLLAASLNAAESLRVRADVWMPFNGGEGGTPGYVTEVLQAIFRPKGIEVDYQSLAWEKSLDDCRASKVDAVPCASVKEAKGLVVPKESIAVIPYGMFVLKSSPWTFAGNRSFAGKRIGVTDGYSYWDELDEFLANNRQVVIKLNDENPCLDGAKKLLSGEVDLVPECPQVFYWTLKQASIPAAQFRMACKMPAEALFVAFRPDEKGREWAMIFDEGMAKLRKSGELATILAKYNVSDWKQ